MDPDPALPPAAEPVLGDGNLPPTVESSPDLRLAAIETGMSSINANMNSIWSLLVTLQAGMSAAAASVTGQTQQGPAQAAGPSTSHGTPPVTKTNCKPPKPDFFTGEGKDRQRVFDWCFTVTVYFEAMGVYAAAERIAYVQTLLRSAALRWWRAIPVNERPTDWETFTHRLITYFLPTGVDFNARKQLERLRQLKSASDYADAFRAIADLVPGMTDNERLATFIRGLKPHVALQLAFAKPTTFEQAVTAAIQIDDLYFQYRIGQRPIPPPTPRVNPHNPRPVHGPTPMDLSAVRATPATNPRTYVQAMQHTNLSKLTDAERARLRAIGACFRCRQTGHMSSQCPLRNQTQNRQ